MTTMPDQGEVLAKAVLRAARGLQLTAAQCVVALGVDVIDPDGAYAMEAGAPIDPHSDAGLRALQLIRIYQRLHAQTGNDRTAMAHWMRTENRQLGSRPIDLLTSKENLGQIEAYLESLTP